MAVSFMYYLQPGQSLRHFDDMLQKSNQSHYGATVMLKIKLPFH
jgi:hypothetical protein